MLNKIALFTIALLGACTISVVANAEPAMQSLRGNLGLQAPSKLPEIKRLQNDSGPIKREYVQQPPLIPHSVKGYVINKKFNKCLTCHSWSNAADAGATKISLTHFADREGKDLANISARRYFCVQCHVPQMDTRPLVDNTFQPIDVLR